MDDVLKMSFEPQTIEHLGVKMYSTLPPALAEMIANAYDACAKKVIINLYDFDPNAKTIIIQDDGVGMSFAQVNEFFLRIGRNRRKEGHKQTNCERIATGKKGLGKLALFGIGDRVIIETIQNQKSVEFTLDWNEILNSTHVYTPEFHVTDTKKSDGTSITLEALKRKTPYSLEELALSLAMLFNFAAVDFVVTISLNDSVPIIVDNKLKYQNIEAEFQWEVEDMVIELGERYEYQEQITGVVLTTEKPLKPHLRGLTLFANGRMVNTPEFFGQSESSHFFSYATGWINVDFVDDWEEDVISTNRQSIDWDHEKTTILRTFLRNLINFIERKWREKRTQKRKENIQIKTKVDIDKWYSTLPKNIQQKVEQLVNSIDISELPEQSQANAIEAIHELVPEYPDFHWRHLHADIKDAAQEFYQKKDYYQAFLEGIKRYITVTRRKSGSTNTTDSGMMGEVYGRGKTLCVTSKYKKPNGTDFTVSTLENIDEGQKFLSMGILSGARNPVAHEEIADLRDSGLFSEKDCLDALSLLSHLIRRLNDA